MKPSYITKIYKWKIEKSSTKTPKFQIGFWYYSWCFSISWMFQFFEFSKIFDQAHFFGLFLSFFGGPLKFKICHGRNAFTAIIIFKSIWEATSEKQSWLFLNTLGLIYSLYKTHRVRNYNLQFHLLILLESWSKFPSLTKIEENF